MQSLKPVRLSYQKSLEFIYYLSKKDDLKLELNGKKNLITSYNDQFEKVFEFRFPLPFPPIMNENNLSNYAQKITAVPQPYIIILIQAGNSALGYFEQGQALNHKVIRKYMVRKKQGKAQITYLKTKGKSRAGSRVRLANTLLFFEEINEKLNEWDKAEAVIKILYSCPVRLWGLLFKSKVKTPFDKKDPRLIKIPLDVNIPNFNELLHVNKFALSGFLNIYKEYQLDFFDGD